jgi:4-amino-4-deoxy-L-arabinose transferase-like glycosyltransferase
MAGGLAGARVAAGFLVAIGLGAAMRATKNLFGPTAAAWGFVACAVSAPVLALGHLAVYDVVAVAGLGISLMALTELARTDHRGWLLVAAGAFAVGVLGKYPTAFMAPVLIALLFALRGRLARVDLVLMGAGVLGFVSATSHAIEWPQDSAERGIELSGDRVDDCDVPAPAGCP